MTIMLNQEIVSGGILEFTMGRKPNKKWGTFRGLPRGSSE